MGRGCQGRLRLPLLGLALAAASGDWAIAWEDNFDGPALNLSNWRVADGVGHNLGRGELQAYFADEVSVANGSLAIRTRLNPGTLNASDPSQSYNWTSGWVDTAGNVQLAFGRVEASIRLPELQDGVWPAFWIEDDAEAGGGARPAGAGAAAASTHCWPTGGEIDILEAWGADGGLGEDDGAVKATYHWGRACGEDDWWSDGALQGRASREQFCGAGANFSDSFHNFTLYWNATHLTWSVDGTPIVTRAVGLPADLFVPQWPLWVILNTAVDSYHGQPAHDWREVVMLVDRVTWWQWAGPSPPGHFPVPVANITLNGTETSGGAGGDATGSPQPQALRRGRAALRTPQAPRRGRAPPCAPLAGNVWSYGNPSLGCRELEIDMSVTGLCSDPPCGAGNNSFCSPPCDAATKACPSSYPPGSTSEGECVVELNGFNRPTFCALVCGGAGAACGAGAECRTVSSWGGPKRNFCVYP